VLDVSIIIVNYNVKYFVEQCLWSIDASRGQLKIEILVVDNASQDGSLEYLKPRFPEVKFISNIENIGFGRANNLALAQASGRYLLVLNPDTLLGEDTLSAMVEYLEAHPKAGAIGPKLLNRYGIFDKNSKRGLPTPWAAFCRISGLSRLFPRSRFFGKYDLLYLDPDQPAKIDALPGACMMVRMEVYEQVGGFDEDYFMYGEDIDWSYRIAKADWEIHYAPVTKIVHFQGESTRRSNLNRDHAFYGAMHLFADKHFRGKYSWFAHYLINFGIILAWMVSRLKSIWKMVFWQFVDGFGLWCIIAVGRWIRWGMIGLNWPVTIALSIQSIVWVASMAGFGVYKRRRGQNAPLFWGMLLGFLINSSFIYFFKQFAYSRFVTLFGVLVGGLFVWGWRAAIRRFIKTEYWQGFLRRRVIIIGIGNIGREVWKRLKTDGTLPYTTVGFIDPEELAVGSIIDELPVIGGEDDLERLLKQEEIEEILFAYDRIDYERVLELVSRTGKLKGVDFKLITSDLIHQSNKKIPLLSVEYLTPRGLIRSLRKITTIAFGKGK